MERLEEIDKRLAEIQDQDRPSSDLIEELKAKRSQLKSILNEYASGDKQADRSSAAMGSGAGEIGRGVDEATGRAAVERRIAALESILTERGHL